jgi:hypothetical protein
MLMALHSYIPAFLKVWILQRPHSFQPPLTLTVPERPLTVIQGGGVRALGRWSEFRTSHRLQRHITTQEGIERPCALGLI